MVGHLPIVLSALITVSGGHEGQNRLYDRLLTSGVTVGGKTLAVLPAPTLADHTDAATQRAALDSIPKRVPLQAFTRNSVVAPYAMSLVGCCQFVASLFGRAPNLAFVTPAEFEALLGAEAAAVTFDHVHHSPCSSVEKGRKLLGYRPRYTTEQIYVECIEYMLASGTLSV